MRVRVTMGQDEYSISLKDFIKVGVGSVWVVYGEERIKERTIEGMIYMDER